MAGDEDDVRDSGFGKAALWFAGIRTRASFKKGGSSWILCALVQSEGGEEPAGTESEA
jgi:hypothetical protein